MEKSKSVQSLTSLSAIHVSSWLYKFFLCPPPFIFLSHSFTVSKILVASETVNNDIYEIIMIQSRSFYQTINKIFLLMMVWSIEPLQINELFEIILMHTLASINFISKADRKGKITRMKICYRLH